MLTILNKTSIVYLGVLSGFLYMITPLNKYKSLFSKITINIFTTLLIFISFVNIQNFGNNEWIVPIIASIAVTIIGIIIPKNLFKNHKATPAEICTATFPNALNFASAV